MLESVGVERGADGADLAVHHPARRHDVGAGLRLGDRGLGVDLERGVVVDRPVVADDPAVPVAGVLVDAEIGHQHDVVADLAAQLAERDLHDAVGVERRRAHLVLVGRHAEQHHGAHSHRRQFDHALAQALDGVLVDAGQRADLDRGVDALADEQRRDQIGDCDIGLGDQITQRRRAPQPARPVDREVGRALTRHAAHRTPATDGYQAATGPRRYRLGSMAVQAWFVQEDMTVRPGTPASLSVVVENVGDRTETYTIIPAGLSAAWTTVTRPNVTLFGGSRDVIEVTVRPPAIPSTTSGPTAVCGARDPAERSRREHGHRDDHHGQPVRRSPDHRAATAPARAAAGDLRVHGRQPRQQPRQLPACTSSTPAAASTDRSTRRPSASRRVRAASCGSSCRARRSFFRRAERQVDFEIEATEPEHEPAMGRATLIQPSTIPARTIGRVALALAGIALVVGAWYWVVRPEIRDAADRAVADRVDEFAPTVSTIATTTTTTLPVDVDDDPAVTPATVGEPVSYRIAVDVGITQERSESMSVPPDSQFLMTDLVLQNPNGDLGTAQLLRNGDVLYTWDLGAMNSANEFQPRVSPLPFAPSDNIVLSVVVRGGRQAVGDGLRGCRAARRHARAAHRRGLTRSAQPVARHGRRRRVAAAEQLDRPVGHDAAGTGGDEHPRADADSGRHRHADEEGPVLWSSGW